MKLLKLKSFIIIVQNEYGMIVEEQWLQFSLSTGDYLYMDKMTGGLQTERPPEYRPYLRDDPFEDTISGLFITADGNRDGYIDETDFYMVSHLKINIFDFFSAVFELSVH